MHNVALSIDLFFFSDERFSALPSIFRLHWSFFFFALPSIFQVCWALFGSSKQQCTYKKSAILVGRLILDHFSLADRSAKYRAKETPPETTSHSWNFRNSASELARSELEDEFSLLVNCGLTWAECKRSPWLRSISKKLSKLSYTRSIARHLQKNDTESNPVLREGTVLNACRTLKKWDELLPDHPGILHVYKGMVCQEHHIPSFAFSDTSQDGFSLNFRTDSSVSRPGFRLEFTLSMSTHIRIKHLDCIFDHHSIACSLIQERIATIPVVQRQSR